LQKEKLLGSSYMIDDWTIDGQVNIRNYKLMMNRRLLAS
jgi:hypothetical protein